MLILALAFAASAPTAFTQVHQRDIACVAVMALIADDQRRKAPGYDTFPDAKLRGKTWAAIVGERIMVETGLPQELVGFAMTEAAKAEQNRIVTAAEPASIAHQRFDECLPLMEADLAAASADRPLPKPQ